MRTAATCCLAGLILAAAAVPAASAASRLPAGVTLGPQVSAAQVANVPAALLARVPEGGQIVGVDSAPASAQTSKVAASSFCVTWTTEPPHLSHGAIAADASTTCSAAHVNWMQGCIYVVFANGNSSVDGCSYWSGDEWFDTGSCIGGAPKRYYIAGTTQWVPSGSSPRNYTWAGAMSNPFGC